MVSKVYNPKVCYLTDEQMRALKILATARVSECELVEENPAITSLFRSCVIALDRALP